jgi:hypothetical protein
VNIPVVTTNYPVIYTNVDFPPSRVSSLTIEEGASLTINQGMALDATTITINGTLLANAAASPISINVFTSGGVVNIGPAGAITKMGSDNLVIYSTFNNNAGTVTFTEHGSGDGGIVLMRGGNHTGIFQGEYLFLGNNDVASGQFFNFNSGSQLRVNQLHARSGTVNMSGTYSQPEDTGTTLFVQPNDGTSIVYFKTGLGILKMPETTFIENGGKLILEAQIDDDYSMSKLNLEYNGELQNNDDLNITTQFNWKAGKLTGNGTTTVDSSAAFTMGTSAFAANDFTLDGQTLINSATANWNKRDLTFANSAEIINNGIFNANATTTMIGGTTEGFVNNGYFFKKTAGTTTIMNIPFTNNGTVDVVAGTLVFQQGMDNGEDAVIDLGGGTLDPGDELIIDSDDSLIGSGTLAANLVNEGTVSPGNSAGIITVDGYYTQEAGGTLEIELGGTAAGTEHDQLVVTGTATMNGTLTVTLLPGFLPELGETFFIIDHTIGTLKFDTINLPSLAGGLKLEADFSDDGVTLTVVSASTDAFIFLPMIMK